MCFWDVPGLYLWFFDGGWLYIACQMRVRYMGEVRRAYKCLAGCNGAQPLAALQGQMDGCASLYYPPLWGNQKSIL